MDTELAAIAARATAQLPPLTIGDPDAVRAIITEHVAPDWQLAARFFWGVPTDEDRALVDWEDDALWDEEEG